MNETEQKPKLQLYVVGESSGKPAEWVGCGGRSLVIASSPDEARALAVSGGIATLVDMSSSAQLMAEDVREPW